MARIVALALALALAAPLVPACDRKERAPAPAAGSQAAGSQAAPAEAPGAEISAAESLRRITQLADKLCACPDRACADAAKAELTEENRRLEGRPRAKPTPPEVEAMRAQAKRLAACMQRLP